MAAPALAIVSALREEIAPLLRRARLHNQLRAGAARFAEATLGERRVILGSTGDGQNLAAAGLEALLDRFKVSELIFVGIAGGLSPELEAGDLVAPTQVFDHDGLAPPPDSQLLERALTAEALMIEGVRAGTLRSAERIASTTTEKLELWRALGEPKAAIVDLETATWARIATARAIPYLALRAVSDTAREDLPLDFNRFTDAGGHVKPWRVALHALGHPRCIPKLRQLQRRLRDGAERLGEVVTGLVIRGQ